MTTQDDFLRLQHYGLQEAADVYRQPIRPTIERSMQVLAGLGKEILPILRKNTPVGVTRHLRDSSGYRVYQDYSSGETVMILELTQPATNLVSGFRYSRTVRSGRRPGRMPPYRQLQRWVQLKWGVSERLSAAKAYQLAKHIARVGTQPNPYFQRTLEESKPLLEAASLRLGQEIAFDMNQRIKVATAKTQLREGFRFQ